MGVVIYGGLECAIPIPEQHAYAVPFLVPNSQVNLFLVSGEKPCRNRLGLLPDFVRFADSKCAVTVAEHDGYPRRVARAGNRGVQLAVIIEVPHGDCVAGHVKGERRRDRGPQCAITVTGENLETVAADSFKRDYVGMPADRKISGSHHDCIRPCRIGDGRLKCTVTVTRQDVDRIAAAASENKIEQPVAAKVGNSAVEGLVRDGIASALPERPVAVSEPDLHASGSILYAVENS